MTGRSRACAAIIAALGTLAVAPVARAATLTVDDDGVECPAAGFSTIQNAIFAAAKGDTIAVCPGTYVEGPGSVGSNALTIIDDVTIKGAGADLVRIVPRHTTAAGGQIAASTPNIRDNVGAIVMIDGDSEDRQSNAGKTHLTKVDISGVTIDGDGVYAEAGVVFRDAVGSVVRSRVTNLVTTDKSLDTPRPGEYKGSPDGFGIAQVTASGAVFPTVARQVKVDHTRVDKYNSAGILVDSATGDVPPLTASGITNIGTISSNQIVGRNICADYQVNGNCQSPAPVPATNGPLYGQDGVRITAGAIGNLTNNTISQNLVQGTGSAVRNSATNNSTLWMAAGVRIIGGGASTISASNIVDNSYGVFNAKLDGTTANTDVPVKAENNWWGLRFGAVTANPGPAISPATNPPVPENPVNGAGVADGTGTSSDAVDFFPYRNGFQSDPDSGELPTVDAPLPVSDAPPSISLATDAGTYHRGAAVVMTASPADDFGVRQVLFYDGPWLIGSANRPPYKVTYKLPGDIGCTTRTLIAVASDSSGQTKSASSLIGIDPADCAAPTPTPTPTPTSTAGPVTTATGTTTVGGVVTPGPGVTTDEPFVRTTTPAPAVSFGAMTGSIASTGVIVNVTPVAAAGVRQLDVFLGTRRVCSLTKAPFRCKIVPNGRDVGRQSLRVVVTDLNGASAESSRNVVVLQFKPKALSVSATTRHSRTVVSGKLKLPSQVTLDEGCASGSVSLIVKRGSRVVSDSQVRLSSSCSFTKHVSGRSKSRLSVSARFSGNKVLAPVRANRRFS
ncbi:right-handed parallel beta-helix repeat-containing protein [Candidatus Solirubrobacter pratensis]|uniref:hypothetical protein n=1 Tax=Candidatus Solirubrobacter pratensis TaxID=1298857 RepID=UPI000424D897|nr:hypothetical protein [Candidatus Solirubrobacter pratensis]